MSSLKNLLYKSLGYGCLRSQRAFEKLYSQAIFGMNYASPAFENNGEINAMRYVARQLRNQGVRQPIVFDVGANTGEYAVALHQTLPNALIHCFEPAAATLEALKKKTDGIPDVSCYAFGFGEVEAELTLYADSPASKTASLYDLPDDHHWKGSHVETVPIKTVDGFCREADIARIHLLKVDVEGHELAVLKGARQMLETGAVDFIQFEFGFRQIDSRTYFRDFFLLLNEKYRIYRILKDGLVPLDRYHEGLEIFVLVSNYIAEIRR